MVFSVDAVSTGAGTVSTRNRRHHGTLTVTTAGTIVLDANQAADANYLAAPQVQEVLVVNQATQTITFTPVATPLHYIAACSPITLCATSQHPATGGATNNLVALSPDPSNAVIFTILSSSVKNGITTATIALVPNQSLNFPANLIIDGNQQGNSNYAAATQAKITISVLGGLPLQSITWPNPGTQVGSSSTTTTTLALTATASSGFPVTYTSSTSTVCTVSGSTVTFVKVTSASACTITATQPGDNLTFAAAVPLVQTFNVNPAGQSPNLNMSLSLSSLTIQPGTVGLTQITLTSVNNFAVSSIAFSCSGLPTGYTCTFNPNPVTRLCPELDNWFAPGHNRNHDADHYAARIGCRCPPGIQAALPGDFGSGALLPGLQEAQPALHARVACCPLCRPGLCLRMRRYLLEHDNAAGHVHSNHHRDAGSRACWRVGIGEIELNLDSHLE